MKQPKSNIITKNYLSLSNTVLLTLQIKQLVWLYFLIAPPIQKELVFCKANSRPNPTLASKLFIFCSKSYVKNAAAQTQTTQQAAPKLYPIFINWTYLKWGVVYFH